MFDVISFIRETFYRKNYTENLNQYEVGFFTSSTANISEHDFLKICETTTYHIRYKVIIIYFKERFANFKGEMKKKTGLIKL